MEERAATSFDADRQCRVVAIAASAGGHAAVSAVRRSLPEPFTVPIIVMHGGEAGAGGTAQAPAGKWSNGWRRRGRRPSRAQPEVPVAGGPAFPASAASSVSVKPAARLASRLNGPRGRGAS